MSLLKLRSSLEYCADWALRLSTENRAIPPPFTWKSGLRNCLEQMEICLLHGHLSFGQCTKANYALGQQSKSLKPDGVAIADSPWCRYFQLLTDVTALFIKSGKSKPINVSSSYWLKLRIVRLRYSAKLLMLDRAGATDANFSQFSYAKEDFLSMQMLCLLQ